MDCCIPLAFKVPCCPTVDALFAQRLSKQTPVFILWTGYIERCRAVTVIVGFLDMPFGERYYCKYKSSIFKYDVSHDVSLMYK